jgi:nucleotide-binding universal stress UspA family protein
VVQHDFKLDMRRSDISGRETLKVLIAIDGSDCSKNLISEVTSRSWLPTTKFLVLNVVAMPVVEFWQNNYEKDIDTLTKATALTVGAVNELKKKFGPQASVKRSFAQGNVAESIVQVARDWCADLIMLGSHGRAGIPRLLRKCGRIGPPASQLLG